MNANPRGPRGAWRALPALAALALLTAAALPAARTPSAPASTVVPDAMVYRACTLPLQQSPDSGLAWPIPAGGGVTQPFASQANVSGFTLNLNSGTVNTGGGIYNFVQWDPVALAPDPTTDALRSAAFGVSGGYWGSGYVPLVPPVVLKRLPSLAESPRGGAACDLRMSYSGPGWMNALFTETGDAGIPVALGYYSQAVSRQPLPGTHPVIGHAVCGGDAMLQDLYVIQSVMTCSVELDTAAYDVMQRFRVPVESQLHWLEVAAGVTRGAYGWPGGSMGVLDATGEAEPSTSLSSPLVSAHFSIPYADSWTSHYDFDRIITLEPNHDYWLWLRLAHGMGVRVRALTGGEGTNFTGAIGPLYVRNDSTRAFAEVPNAALAFRLIGVPLGMVGVEPEPASRAAFALRVTPNPSHGPVLLAWSGAKGAVRIDVLDVRGRRVGGGAAGGAGAGQWLWSAARTGGGPVAPGVYFVRARDAAGAVASERVTIVR